MPPQILHPGLFENAALDLLKRINAEETEDTLDLVAALCACANALVAISMRIGNLRPE